MLEEVVKNAFEEAGWAEKLLDLIKTYLARPSRRDSCVEVSMGASRVVNDARRTRHSWGRGGPIGGFWKPACAELVSASSCQL